MAVYRVDYFDHGGYVYSTEYVEHDDDDTVIECLRHLNDHGIGAGYSIWEGDRLVHEHRR